MKKLTVLSLLLLFVLSVPAQPIFDVGVKAGINNSKITANLDEFNSESILKMHVGAFARIGYGRLYVQPEAYFSAKGGELESSVSETVTKFDFNNIDVPVLFGVNVLKRAPVSLRIMAGPVFSFVTSKDVDGDSDFSKEYFEDNYFGYQYGIGVDFWKLTLDARIEHGTNNLYEHPDSGLNSENRTFLVSLGFKIL
jgi:hypothetical protein